jgi:hypothetical protein
MGFTKLFLIFYTAATTNIQQLRVNYFNAAQNKPHMQAFEKTIESYQKKDHTYYCYLAAYYSLMSNYSSGISAKLKLFKICKTTLEKSFAIKDSFDARFIRFCIQSNVPSILDYKDKLNEDKKYLITHIQTVPPSEFKKQVKTFLEKSKALNQNEKEQLNKL